MPRHLKWRGNRHILSFLRPKCANSDQDKKKGYGERSASEGYAEGVSQPLHKATVLVALA